MASRGRGRPSMRGLGQRSCPAGQRSPASSSSRSPRGRKPVVGRAASNSPGMKGTKKRVLLKPGYSQSPGILRSDDGSGTDTSSVSVTKKLRGKSRSVSLTQPVSTLKAGKSLKSRSTSIAALDVAQLKKAGPSSSPKVTGSKAEEGENLKSPKGSRKKSTNVEASEVEKSVLLKDPKLKKPKKQVEVSNKAGPGREKLKSPALKTKLSSPKGSGEKALISPKSKKATKQAAVVTDVQPRLKSPKPSAAKNAKSSSPVRRLKKSVPLATSGGTLSLANLEDTANLSSRLSANVPLMNTGKRKAKETNSGGLPEALSVSMDFDIMASSGEDSVASPGSSGSSISLMNILRNTMALRKQLANEKKLRPVKKKFADGASGSTLTESDTEGAGSDVDSVKSSHSQRVNVFDQYQFTGSKSPEADKRRDEMIKSFQAATGSGAVTQIKLKHKARKNTGDTDTESLASSATEDYSFTGPTEVGKAERRQVQNDEQNPAVQSAARKMSTSAEQRPKTKLKKASQSAARKKKHAQLAESAKPGRGGTKSGKGTTKGVTKPAADSGRKKGPGRPRKKKRVIVTAVMEAEREKKDAEDIALHRKGWWLKMKKQQWKAAQETMGRTLPKNAWRKFLRSSATDMESIIAIVESCEEDDEEETKKAFIRKRGKPFSKRASMKLKGTKGGSRQAGALVAKGVGRKKKLDTIHESDKDVDETLKEEVLSKVMKKGILTQKGASLSKVSKPKKTLSKGKAKMAVTKLVEAKKQKKIQKKQGSDVAEDAMSHDLNASPGLVSEVGSKTRKKTLPVPIKRKKKQQSTEKTDPSELPGSSVSEKGLTPGKALVQLSTSKKNKQITESVLKPPSEELSLVSVAELDPKGREESPETWQLRMSSSSDAELEEEASITEADKDTEADVSHGVTAESVTDHPVQLSTSPCVSEPGSDSEMPSLETVDSSTKSVDVDELVSAHEPSNQSNSVLTMPSLTMEGVEESGDFGSSSPEGESKTVELPPPKISEEKPVKRPVGRPRKYPRTPEDKTTPAAPWRAGRKATRGRRSMDKSPRRQSLGRKAKEKEDAEAETETGVESKMETAEIISGVKGKEVTEADTETGTKSEVETVEKITSVKAKEKEVTETEAETGCESKGETAEKITNGNAKDKESVGEVETAEIISSVVASAAAESTDITPTESAADVAVTPVTKLSVSDPPDGCESLEQSVLGTLEEGVASGTASTVETDAEVEPSPEGDMAEQSALEAPRKVDDAHQTPDPDTDLVTRVQDDLDKSPAVAMETSGDDEPRTSQQVPEASPPEVAEVETVKNSDLKDVKNASLPCEMRTEKAALTGENIGADTDDAQTEQPATGVHDSVEAALGTPVDKIVKMQEQETGKPDVEDLAGGSTCSSQPEEKKDVSTSDGALQPKTIGGDSQAPTEAVASEQEQKTETVSVSAGESSEKADSTQKPEAAQPVQKLSSEAVEPAQIPQSEQTNQPKMEVVRDAEEDKPPAAAAEDERPKPESGDDGQKHGATILEGSSIPSGSQVDQKPATSSSIPLKQDAQSLPVVSSPSAVDSSSASTSESPGSKKSRGRRRHWLVLLNDVDGPPSRYQRYAAKKQEQELAKAAGQQGEAGRISSPSARLKKVRKLSAKKRRKSRSTWYKPKKTTTHRFPAATQFIAQMAEGGEGTSQLEGAGAVPPLRMIIKRAKQKQKQRQMSQAAAQRKVSALEGTECASSESDTGKPKMATRGKKNRYWYLFAKKRKGRDQDLLSRPPGAEFPPSPKRRSFHRPPLVSAESFVNKTQDELKALCLPCSVVLIDFIKCLDIMNEPKADSGKPKVARPRGVGRGVQRSPSRGGGLGRGRGRGLEPNMDQVQVAGQGRGRGRGKKKSKKRQLDEMQIVGGKRQRKAAVQRSDFVYEGTASSLYNSDILDRSSPVKVIDASPTRTDGLPRSKSPKPSQQQVPLSKSPPTPTPQGSPSSKSPKSTPQGSPSSKSPKSTQQGSPPSKRTKPAQQTSPSTAYEKQFMTFINTETTKPKLAASHLSHLKRKLVVEPVSAASTTPSVSTSSKQPNKPSQPVVAPQTTVKPAVQQPKVKRTARKQQQQQQQIGTSIFLKFRCLHCSYATQSRPTMQEHIYNHTDVVPYCCGHCGAIFGTVSGVKMHSKREHQQLPPNIIKTSTIVEEDYYTTTEEYERLYSKREGSAQMCSPESENPAPSSRMLVSVVNTDPMYQCKHCSFQHCRSEVMENHCHLRHPTLMRLVCPLCDHGSCKFEEAMRAHFQSWHPGKDVLLQYESGYTMLAPSADGTTPAVIAGRGGLLASPRGRGSPGPGGRGAIVSGRGRAGRGRRGLGRGAAVGDARITTAASPPPASSTSTRVPQSFVSPSTTTTPSKRTARKSGPKPIQPQPVPGGMQTSVNTTQYLPIAPKMVMSPLPTAGQQLILKIPSFAPGPGGQQVPYLIPLVNVSPPLKPVTPPPPEEDQEWQPIIGAPVSLATDEELDSLAKHSEEEGSEEQPAAVEQEETMEQEETVPEPEKMAPEPQKTTPEPKQTAPEPQKTAPEPQKTAPEPKQTAPEPQKMAPEPHKTASEPQKTAPEPQKTAPEPQKTAPEPEKTAPEPVKTAPEPVKTAPEPQKTAPEPLKTAPELQKTAPEPQNTAPKPVKTVPEPQKTAEGPEKTVPETAPEPQKTAPEPEKTAPEPEKTAPEPEKTAPEPEKTAPEPEKTVPDPEKPAPEPKMMTSEPEKSAPEPEKSAPEPERTAMQTETEQMATEEESMLKTTEACEQAPELEQAKTPLPEQATKEHEVKQIAETPEQEEKSEVPVKITLDEPMVSQDELEQKMETAAPEQDTPADALAPGKAGEQDEMEVEESPVPLRKTAPEQDLKPQEEVTEVASISSERPEVPEQQKTLEASEEGKTTRIVEVPPSSQPEGEKATEVVPAPHSKVPVEEPSSVIEITPSATQDNAVEVPESSDVAPNPTETLVAGVPSTTSESHEPVRDPSTKHSVQIDKVASEMAAEAVSVAESSTKASVCDMDVDSSDEVQRQGSSSAETDVSVTKPAENVDMETDTQGAVPGDSRGNFQKPVENSTKQTEAQVTKPQVVVEDPALAKLPSGVIIVTPDDETVNETNTGDVASTPVTTESSMEISASVEKATSAEKTLLKASTETTTVLANQRRSSKENSLSALLSDDTSPGASGKTDTSKGSSPTGQEYMCKEISSTSDEPMEVPQPEPVPADSDISSAQLNNNQFPSLKIVSVCSLATPDANAAEQRKDAGKPAAAKSLPSPTRRRYQCQLCTDILPSLNTAMTHINSVHNVVVPHFYSCPHCDFASRGGQDMQSHLHDVHPDKEAQPLQLANQDKFFKVVGQKTSPAAETTPDVASAEDDLLFVRAEPSRRKPDRPVGPVRPTIAGNPVGPELPVTVSQPDAQFSQRRQVNQVNTMTQDSATRCTESGVIITQSLPTVINVTPGPVAPPQWPRGWANNPKQQITASLAAQSLPPHTMSSRAPPTVPARLTAPRLPPDGASVSAHGPPPLIPLGRLEAPVDSKLYTGRHQLGRTPRPAHTSSMRTPMTGTVRPMVVSPPRRPMEDDDEDEEEVSPEAFSVFNIGPRLRNPGQMPRLGVPRVPRPMIPAPPDVAKWRQFQARRPGVPQGLMSQPRPPLGGVGMHPAFTRTEARLMAPPNVTMGMRLTAPNVTRSAALHPTQQRHPAMGRPCPYCPFSAPDVDTLHSHILTHEPGMQIHWTCPYCVVNTKMTKGFVEKHICTVHPGKKIVYIPYGVKV